MGEDRGKLSSERPPGGFIFRSFWESSLSTLLLEPLGAPFPDFGCQWVPKVSILGAKRCQKSDKNRTFWESRES